MKIFIQLSQQTNFPRKAAFSSGRGIKKGGKSMERKMLIWDDGYRPANQEELPKEVVELLERFKEVEAILILDGAPLNDKGGIDIKDPEQFRVFRVEKDGHLVQLTGSKKRFHFIRAFMTQEARTIFRETWSVPMFVL